MTIYNDADGFRIEAALQFGFRMTNDDGDEYACTESQLIAFAKACERKGRAEASKLAQTRSHENRVAHMHEGAVALDCLAGELDQLNDATDAELKPILEAERQRSFADDESKLICAAPDLLDAQQAVTRRMLNLSPHGAKLDQLLRDAIAIFNSLTPEQQEAQLRAQREMGMGER